MQLLCSLARLDEQCRYVVIETFFVKKIRDDRVPDHNLKLSRLTRVPTSIREGIFECLSHPNGSLPTDHTQRISLARARRFWHGEAARPEDL